MELVADTSSAGPSSVCMLSCTASVRCRFSGECVLSALSRCGVLMMLLPIGVDDDAGIIVINCSGSVTVARFVGEFAFLCIFCQSFFVGSCWVVTLFVCWSVHKYARVVGREDC